MTYTTATVNQRGSEQHVHLRGGHAYDPEHTSIQGRAEAVNILTHTPIWRALTFQPLAFFASRRSRWAAENIAKQRSQTLQLKRLNFLYTARWVRLGRWWGPSFPTAHLPWWLWEGPFRRWVLFASNFNFEWDPYFHAFLDTQGSGINYLWGDSSGYPGHPAPRTRYETVDWTYRRLPRSDHYYCAYPEATAFDVRAALRLDRELRAFIRGSGESSRTDRDGAGGLELRSTDPGFDDLLTRLQPCLGRMDGDIAPKLRPDPIDQARSYREAERTTDTGVFGFVSIVPVEPDRVAQLEQKLDELTRVAVSPFAHVRGVHFARIALIRNHQPGGEKRQGVELRNTWLLFVVDFDGDFALVNRNRPRFKKEWIDDFAESVWAAKQRGQPMKPLFDIFDCCRAERKRRIWYRRVKQPRFCRDTEMFAASLYHGTGRRYARYYDYPDATLPTIRAALANKRNFVDWLASTDRSDAFTLEPTRPQ